MRAGLASRCNWVVGLDWARRPRAPARTRMLRTRVCCGRAYAADARMLRTRICCGRAYAADARMLRTRVCCLRMGAYAERRHFSAR